MLENAKELRSEMKNWPMGQIFIFCSVFISIAGGRWASYIGIPSVNLFLIDVLFFSGWILCLSKFVKESTFHSALFHLILVLFIIAQFMRNPEYSAIVRIRDELPFIYFLTLPVIAFLFSSISLKFIIILVRFATLFHIFWLLPVLLGILKPLTIGGPFGIPIFSDRWDQSGIAIATGLLAWQGFPEYKLFSNNFLRMLFIICGLFQWSRASLIAILISLLISLKTKSKKPNSQVQRNFSFPILFAYSAVIFVLLLPALAPLFPANSVLNRLGITNFSESLISGAADTADARKISQNLLLEWVKNRNQLLLGVGPGTEMVLESGAYLYLSGDQKVRSPHSWLYGGICRFGFVGFAYWLLLLLNGFKPHFKISKLLNPPFCFVLPILIVSLFGVIVESPFGSLPLVFFTAVSIRKKS